MKNLFCLLFILVSLAAEAQCSFSLGPDQTFCQGQTISTVLSAPAGQSSYQWSTGATTQSITATAAGVYTCTVTLLSSNLVTNSDFNSGNTGFSSSYTVGAGGTWGPLSSEGTYYITNNANIAHTNFPSFSGHGGSGNMMVVNGSGTPGTSVWCNSFAVTPNTNYNFSAWVATCVASSNIELADLQFSINGSLIGSQFSPSISSGVWTQFNATWNSGTNTTANICIVNQNTTLSGNDFAIDDIFFQQVCTANDNVQIIVNPSPAVSVPSNSTVCPGNVVPASAFSSTPAGATFAWSNNNTATGLAAGGTGNTPSFTATNAGSSAISSVVTVTPTLSGCVGTPQNYTITVNPTPVLSIPASQTVCANASTTLVNFSSTPAGSTFNWTNSDASIGLASNGTGNINSFTALNSGSTGVTSTINVIPVLNSCTGIAGNFNITVNPIPTISVPANITACPNDIVSAAPFTTNPLGANVNWTNDNTATGLAASGTGNVGSFTAANSSSAAIASIISASPVLNGCNGTAQSYTINVNPLPVLNPVTSQTICVNNTTSDINFVSTPAGASVSWINSDASIGLPATGSGDILSFNGQNSGASPVTGNITATPTLNACVGSPISFDIIVSPGPSLAAVTSQTVCAGSSTTAINFSTMPAGIATINWTNSSSSIGIAANGIGNIASTLVANTTSNAVTANIIATPSIGTCVGNPQSFAITVEPLPVINQVSDVSICNTNTVPASTFSGSASATFTWINTNTSIGLAASGTGDYASFTGTNTSTSPVIASITVTPQLNSCIGSPITYSISVNPTPAPPTTNTVAPYCLNDAAQVLSAAPSNGGTLLWWGTNAAGGTSSVTPTTPSTSVAGTTIYYVSQTVLACESPRAPIQVSVSNPPGINAVNDTSVCAGASVAQQNFTTTPAGATINWLNNNASIGLGASGTGSIPSFVSTNSGTSVQTSVITVTPSIGSCVGAPITYSINVNPLPAVSVSNKTACNNSSVAAINWTSNPVGATYTWNNSNVSIGLAASGTNSIPSFTAINNGSSPVNALINVTPSLNGCAGPSSVFTITVNQTPVAPTVGATPTYCRNAGAIQLTPNGNEYLWYNAASGGTGTTTSPIPSTAAAGTQSYYVSQTINGCEGPRSLAQVIVKELPSANLKSIAPKCPPLCTDLILSSPGNIVEYNWNLGDGTSFNGNDTVTNHCYINTGTYNVTVKIEDAGGCSNTLVFTNAVMVAEIPEATFTYNPQPISILDPVVNFTNESVGTEPMTYQWNTGVDESFLTQKNPTVMYEEAGNYNVMLVATNAYGCSDTVYKTLVVNGDVTFYVPNSFTPNNDGVNETFKAEGIGISKEKFAMYIFDRWGEKVFQTNDPDQAWNGKINDTEKIMEDTYIWRIVYSASDGNSYIKSGHVTVVR